MLHRDTANVKIIQTPRDILEAVGRRGVGPKCKGGVQAQVNGAALPQLPLFLRVILNEKEEWYLYIRHGLYHTHLTIATGEILTPAFRLFSLTGWCFIQSASKNVQLSLKRDKC